MRCQQPWVDSARRQHAQLICDRAQLSLQHNDRSNMQTHLVLNAPSPSLASFGPSIELLSLTGISVANWNAAKEWLLLECCYSQWYWLLLYSQWRHICFCIHCEMMEEEISTCVYYDVRLWIRALLGFSESCALEVGIVTHLTIIYR